MASLSTYQYSELSGRRLVRLLELHSAADGDSTVSCSLRDASLDDSGVRYKALPYAWGDTSHKTTTLIDG